MQRVWLMYVHADPHPPFGHLLPEGEGTTRFSQRASQPPSTGMMAPLT
ncbi:hypothetical protein CFBP2533_02180 [Xanthomonas hortorum pv. pelargonii]|uniref:Uncharacterized protein n=1 Tax=Xanthomonas hortorum pv. pelargonii TaxID=453602 RepID=A0A6V7BG17_9XANT|nr:hypothetical protein CFBP2533_02180 [Xanthomonas hortorum pv. pelargonii]CAD0300375.1 hypothetical protein CFBP2533_02180 [Xanthomonas hortorum pv. pelargonii]